MFRVHKYWAAELCLEYINIEILKDELSVATLETKNNKYLGYNALKYKKELN